MEPKRLNLDLITTVFILFSPMRYLNKGLTDSEQRKLQKAVLWPWWLYWLFLTVKLQTKKKSMCKHYIYIYDIYS